MLKLYKRSESGEILYHEAWAEGDEIVEHWGRLGTKGQVKSHSRQQLNIETVLAPASEKGYRPIGDDDYSFLVIEYAIDGFGTPDDLYKRCALQARMDATLGWTGLGRCDGGCIGSDTMEVCCFVVDFALAKKVIEHDLRDTEFADYSRIYCSPA
jgi:hypothetical protein